MSATPATIPPRPVPLAPIVGNVPASLTGYDHFVLWDYELRDGRDGPMWTKPLLAVNGRGHAKSNDAATWASFRATVNAHRIRKTAGFGFALGDDDPFCFGDIDKCRNPETGEIAPWAQPLLRRFAGTYQEVSPSGAGVKIIARGKLPGAEHRWKLGQGSGEYVEWFDGGKYTTLTGHRLPDAGEDAADCQAELDALYRECFPPKADPPKPASSRIAEPPNLDDDAILQRARNSRDGPRFIQLFDSGNTSLYGNDDSAADIALCGMLAFWFGNDPDRIDRVFRRSALMRDKWADRADYRKLTIDKVLSGRTEFYTPRALRRSSVVPEQATDAPKRQTRWTAAELLAAELPEPRWAVPDLIPEGLTILAGRPKKGKSRLALSVALAVASGIPALGHFEVEQGGDVLFCGLEDGPGRLQERLQDMLGKRPAPPNLDLWIDLPKLGEGCEAEIERWIVEHPRARLIVLDTYQRLRKPPNSRDGNAYAVDYEDAAKLQRLAQTHQIAIILICHTRKPTGGTDPFDDVLGSTGNTAAADAIAVLQTERGRADAKLLVTGRDIEEAEHALQNDSTTGRWIRIGDAADVRRSSQRGAILAALRAAEPNDLKPHEIAVYTKQRSGSVRVLLHRMRNDGEVEESAGRYRVRNSGNGVTFGQKARSDAANSVTASVTPPVTRYTTEGVTGVTDVASVTGVTDVTAVTSWTCECGADVLGHLAHCPLCGRGRS